MCINVQNSVFSVSSVDLPWACLDVKEGNKNKSESKGTKKRQQNKCSKTFTGLKSNIFCSLTCGNAKGDKTLYIIKLYLLPQS